MLRLNHVSPTICRSDSPPHRLTLCKYSLHPHCMIMATVNPLTDHLEITFDWASGLFCITCLLQSLQCISPVPCFCSTQLCILYAMLVQCTAISFCKQWWFVMIKTNISWLRWCNQLLYYYNFTTFGNAEWNVCWICCHFVQCECIGLDACCLAFLHIKCDANFTVCIAIICQPDPESLKS